MHSELPSFTIGNIIDILRKCKQQKLLSYAELLHAHMCEHSLESHPQFGNELVPTLVQCHSLLDARSVFERLLHRNGHSWTSLISGYIESGNLQQAFHLYSKMQEQYTARPNAYTYLALLQACAAANDIVRGHALHAEIVKVGFDGDLYMGSAALGNTLVDMYSKCGYLEEAHQTFQALPLKDLVSWNALIAGYAGHGFAQEAGKCYQKMQLNCISPDSFTFVCTLKACRTIKTLEMGRKLHSEIIRRGLEQELYVANALLDMYVNCDSLVEAHLIFWKLPVRDSVSWSAIFAGCADHGSHENLETYFHQIQLDGVLPDSIMFICSLKACSTMKALGMGQELHAEIIKRGLNSNVSVGNSLVDMYMKFGLPAEAHNVFDQCPVHDAVSWNILITGYAERGLVDKSKYCFLQMQLDGISPNSITFLGSLKACGDTRVVVTGQFIHAELTKRALEKDLCVGNTLVAMYSKCGFVAEARRVFDKLSVRDVVSWAALIAGYAECGLDEEMLKCFKEIQLEDLSMDAATFVHCLKACGSTGALETGREIHAEIRESGLETDIFVSSMLIDMYGKCGSVKDGREVFDKLPVQDVVSWTTMIKVYGENHEGNMALQCFEEMQKKGVKPNTITFTCLLAACSHSSLVLKGQEYFRMMREDYGIEPTLDHYACMVDLLARSGLVYEAERFITAIQCSPSSVMLMALLSACKIYEKLELGQRCFQQLVELKEDDASACLLMADIYTNAGRWRDAERLFDLRKFTGTKKKPGSASMETTKKLHEFVVDGKQSEIIFNRFELLCLYIKNEGYVPNLDSVPRYNFKDGNGSIPYGTLCNYYSV